METTRGSPAPARSTGQQLARASWVIFIAIVIANVVLRKTLPVVVDWLAIGATVTGVALAAAALARVGREGRRGILAPALTGLVLNGVLVLIWVSNFLAYRARHG